MKNLKLIALGIAFALGSGASAQCLNLNGDMETFTAPRVNSNAWINNHLTNWNVSHGTPTPGGTPTTNIWMWSYDIDSDGVAEGEGIYTGFNFVAGVTYEVCYDVWRDGTSNPASQVHVELTNGLTPSGGGSFEIPNPASQALTTQPWTGTGTWVTIVETFTAGANYSQLWFYPRLDGAPTPWQAACRIDNVCVKEVSVDPCDFEPTFAVTYDEECNVRFTNTTAVPSGLTILETYWDFGDGTTGTGMTVDHFYANGGAYEVCMTVWMINEDGECCQLRVCEWVDAPDCDPCEWLERAEITVTGTNPFTFTVSGGLPSGMYNVLGYHWNFGDGNTATGQTVTHTYAAGGGYLVCVTIYYYDPETRECCNATICIDVEAEDPPRGRGPATTPLEEGVNYEEADMSKELEDFNNVILAPNPNDGVFDVRLKNGDDVKSIHVYDRAGKLVYTTQNTGVSNILHVDLKQLEKGLYLITINEADEMTRAFEKVVIK